MSPASITKIRNDRENRVRRHVELARLLRDNPDATNIELARALHVNRDTIAEDRKHLMSVVNGEAKTEMVLYREQQLAELVGLRDVLSDPKIKPDRKVELTLAIIDREMRLTGTAAPTKSVVGHVNATENLGPYRKFVLACSGLDLDQIEQLLVMAREMPRISRPRPEPPTTSPLWVKQLKEANDETA
jgi:DNA-binding CsgD family transcriptional regulator